MNHGPACSVPKDFKNHVRLTPATRDDYPLIQNMARFYAYDLSKECEHLANNWHLPTDDLAGSFDFRSYFEESSRAAYLIRVQEDITGFVLINQYTLDPKNHWSMGEFFILGRYQRKGVGQEGSLSGMENPSGTLGGCCHS